MAKIGNLLDPLNRNRRFTHNSKNVVFLTYCDKDSELYNCEESAKKLIEQAKSMDMFSEIIMETNKICEDDEFKLALKNNQFKSIYNTNKGYGMWLWKPYIIYKHLKRIDDNSILIYCDAGGRFPNNPILKCWAKNKLKEYFLFLDEHEGCMSFESGFSEFFTTKSEVFDYFNNYNIVEDYLTQSRITNLHIMKKTSFSFDIYSQWWNICKNNPYLFDDCICRKKTHDGFIDTRNDQSVWSLLCKSKNVAVHHDTPSKRPIRVSTRPIQFNNEVYENRNYTWYDNV